MRAGGPLARLHSGRARRSAAALVAAGLAFAPEPWPLLEGPDRTEQDGRAESAEQDELRRRAARMVDEGLAFLAQHQNEDRSFSTVRGEEVVQAPLAVTALSALAFMAGGSTMGRGPYREQVRTAIEYLLDKQVERRLVVVKDGVPVEVSCGYFKVESDGTSRTHGHGYATLAVAQAYGTSAKDPVLGESADEKVREDRARMRRALTWAVKLIECSQSERGGWYYEPGDNLDENSVTITMIQALRAARDVGIEVDKSVIDAAVRYVHRCQRADGGFRYQLSADTVTYALTAAAVATLNATGDYDSKTIDSGLEYMLRTDPVLDPGRQRESQEFPYYARLYAAQAYYQYRDPRHWERWYPRLLEDLESRRDSRGGFYSDPYGRVYATAMTCLLLQIPVQYLPIFQR